MNLKNSWNLFYIYSLPSPVGEERPPLQVSRAVLSVCYRRLLPIEKDSGDAAMKWDFSREIHALNIVDFSINMNLQKMFEGSVYSTWDMVFLFCWVLLILQVVLLKSRHWQESIFCTRIEIVVHWTANEIQVQSPHRLFGLMAIRQRSEGRFMTLIYLILVKQRPVERGGTINILYTLEN